MGQTSVSSLSYSREMPKAFYKVLKPRPMTGVGLDSSRLASTKKLRQERKRTVQACDRCKVKKTKVPSSLSTNRANC